MCMGILAAVAVKSRYSYECHKDYQFLTHTHTPPPTHNPTSFIKHEWEIPNSKPQICFKVTRKALVKYLWISLTIKPQKKRSKNKNKKTKNLICMRNGIIRQETLSGILQVEVKVHRYQSFSFSMNNKMLCWKRYIYLKHIELRSKQLMENIYNILKYSKVTKIGFHNAIKILLCSVTRCLSNKLLSTPRVVYLMCRWKSKFINIKAEFG